MNISRRHFTIGMGAALGMPAALKSGQATAQERVDLEIMGGTFLKELLESLRDGYNVENREASVSLRLGDEEDDKTVQALIRDSLVGIRQPDVVFLNGNLVRLLVDRDIAVHLDPLLDGQNDWNERDFAPAIRATGQVNGKTYGMGLGLSLPVILLNGKLVEAAGVKPDRLPTDWPGILSLARKIDQQTPTTVGGFIVVDSSGAYRFLSMLESMGGRFMNDSETKLTFNSPSGLRVFELYRQFAEAGQARAAMSRSQARQAFGSGTLGVYVDQSSVIPSMEKAAGGDFPVLSIPHPVDAGARLPAAGPNMIVLTRDPKRQRAALDFLKYVVGPAGQMLVVAKSGYSPVNSRAVERSDDIRRVLASRPNAPSYISNLDFASSWYALPGANSVKAARLVIDVSGEVVQAKIAPQRALDELDRQLTPMLGL